MKSLLSQMDGPESTPNVSPAPLDDDLRDLSRGAYSGYDRDFQRLIGDSRSTLKRLTRSFFPEDGGDREPYAKNTYNNLYKINRGEGDGNRYGGLSLPTETDDPFSYALGGARQQTINELIDIDYGGLHDRDRTVRVNTALQKAYDTDQASPYLNRPGVGPVLSVIGSATKEVTIDIFQLQNKVVSDALVEKAKQGVAINIRVAMPDGTEKDATGFSILGPNLIELEKFNRLRADMERDALERGGVAPNINLFVADKKSHPKTILTEREAIIGTLNLTQPVGSDPNQAGANFEAIRRLTRGAYTPEMLAGVSDGTAEQRSAKLYYQLRSVYHDESQGESRSPLAFMEQTKTRPAFTSQSQIVGPGEIYQELRYALDLAGDTSAKQWRGLYAILNQPFLLMLDDPMHRDSMMGEMGRFDKQTPLTDPSHDRARQYRETQRRLFDLINEGRGVVTVDNRGYIEKVVNPMYERVQRLVGGFEETYGGSLEKLVQKLGGTGNYQERLHRLTGRLKDQSHEFDMDTARQLLAMTGGNIKLSTATMQHVKSFAVMEGQGKGMTALSYYLGSSNLGAYSLSISPGDEDVVNREIGLALSHRVTDTGPFSLTRGEVTEELEMARENFSQQWAGLTHTYIGDIGGLGSQGWYESRVHSKGLMELSKRLKAIGEGLTGFDTHYIYGGASGTERVGLEVGIDVGKLTGTGLGGRFNLRYSVLSDMGGGVGFVYDLSTGKVISQSLLQDSSREGLSTPYGELTESIRHQVLDPVSTTLNLVSTLTAEAMNRVYSWGPQSSIADLDQDEKLGLVLDYLDFQVSGKRGSSIDKGTPGMFFLDAPPDALEGFSHHLQGLGIGSSEGIEVVKKLQAFIGMGTPEGRESSHSSLAQALGFIDILTAKEGAATSKQWEMLRGGAGRGIGASLVNLLDTSPEFLLDVVTTMQGPNYEGNLRKGIQGFRDSLMEPFLYMGDISKYSGAQGWHRLPVYQVTDDMVTRIRQGGGGMQGLLSHALMVPSLYDPSSDLGINQVWRSIASKSTINEGIDEVKGATLYGRRGSQVGDVMFSRLGVSLGVSYESRASDIQELLKGGDPLKIQRLIEDRFRGREVTNTYTFDTKGKLASIPQRLKNVGGQKGLMHMTEVAQGILDIERAFLQGQAPVGAIARLRNQGNWLERAALSLLQDNDISLASYMSAYTETLRARVLGLNADARHLITEDMGLAAIYGGRLRTVMGPDHLRQLESYSSYIEKELNQQVDTEEENLAYMVLQAKAVAADMLASGQKGFIGGRVERPLVMLQLSGAYTDHFYANKDYGGGVREGFVETKTVRVRASKLGHQWTTKEDGLLARAGDLISFDRDRNQVMVLNSTGLQKSLTIGQDISSDEVMALAKSMRGQVVDDRAQVMVLDEVIESLHRGEGSSLAQKGVSSYAATRQGEDAIDYLLKVKALPGVTSTGNMEYEFTYASSITPGGGRRVEGAASGGLFKAVGVMSDISGVLEERAAGLNDGLTSSIDRVNIQDVFGIVNISNLKSFFYSHGAGILRDAKGKAPERLEKVVNKSSGQLVAGLLLHFGDAWLGEADGGLAKALVEYIGKGELGEYHKSLVGTLMLKHKGDAEKVGRELLGHKKIGGKFTSDLDRYNITQLPGLANLDKADVLKALSMGGDSGALAKRLGDLAGVEEGKLSKNMRDSMRLAIDLNNPLHRQASILLTSWDITAQLSSQTLVNVGELYLGHDTEGNRNLMKVATVMGFDPLRIQRGLTGENEDTEYSEMARNIAVGLSTRVSSIFLEMDLNYSATKEPSGKKHTGNIEGVQMVKPFLNLATEFRQGGGLNKLKLLIGNLMAGMSLGETASGIASDLRLENTLGQARNLIDPMQQEIGSSFKFLGLYGSGIESIDDLKQAYAEYEGLVREALQERVADASQKASLIHLETDGERRAVLVGERDRLLGEAARLMLEYEDPQKVRDLLGESYKGEYDSLLPRMKAVGERYDLLSSKPMGVGLGNAIVSNMGHDRGLLYLPELNIQGGQDGQVNIHIDRRKRNYTYLPSGEDLGFLGTQYGAHVDEIVMATIRLTGAMTPGTAMSKVMQKLKAAELVGSDRITLSPQEATLLQEYQETFINMNSLLAEKGSGSRLQAAMSGKTTLGGGVTTPAPSWWVPEGSILLSKETLRKQGVNDGERAKRYVETQDAIANLEDKPENQIQRSILKAQSDALLNGLSEAGMYLVSQIRQDRDRLSNLEDYYRQAQDQGDLQRARGLHEEARNLIAINLGRIDEVGKTSYRSILGKGDSGDLFAVRIGELEMEYFIQAFGDMDDLSPGQSDEDILRGVRKGLLNEHNINRLRQKIEGIEGRLERLEKSFRLVQDEGSTNQKALELHRGRLLKLTEKHNLTGEQIEEALALERSFLEGEKIKAQDLLSQDYIDKVDKAIRTGIIPDELQGAIEAKRRGLRERRGLISRGMLDEVLGADTLGGLDDSAYQGKAKGELTTYSFDRGGLNKLSPEGQRALVRGRISNLKAQYADLDRYLEEVERGTYGVGDRGQKLIASGVQRANLKELISTLSSLGTDIDDEFIPIDTSITKIEKAINQLDTTDILQTITFRNAPFGSTETQRQALSVLSGIETINEYIKESRAREGLKGGVLFDIERNETLTLLNPISQLTLNLGDFDGDPYTSIFTSLAKFHREARKIQDIITTHEVIIEEAQTQLKREHERYQALGPAITEEQERALLIARTNLGEKIDRSQEEIVNRRGELNRKLFELEQAKATHTDKYGDAIRKEVADYLGIDKRMFTGRARGGFLDEDLDVSVLPSFLQQGHGLFGGLKGKANTGERLAIMFEKFTEAFVTFGGDSQRLMEGLSQYIGEDNWKVYQESEAVRETLLKEATRITVGVDMTGEIGPIMGQLRPLAHQSAGTLTGILDTQSGANKLMQKAMGASIDDDMYSMLTKVLGKAGGDILGRTYNTLVGTLFADSPLIALSHLLTSNERIKGQATMQLAEFMGRKAGEAGVGGDSLDAAKRFMEILEGESVRAEGLQQFMKNAQQLLRDSLKFKKANDTLDKLAESLDKYNAPDATEDTRRELIKHIAGQLGPGPGLKAFMQLEELVNRVGEKGFDRGVKAFVQQDGGEEWDTLSKEFGISKSNLYEPNAPSDLVREMELTRRAFGLGPGSGTVREVMEYKVARDLQNLIAANRMGLSDDAGDSWSQTMMRGAKGLLDSLGIDKSLEGRELDIHERVRLAFEGADDKARVRMVRAQQVMEHGWYERGQSTDKLVALLSHIESSFQESSEAFGFAGERLKRMTTLRVIGKGLTNMAAGRGDASPTLIGDDPDLIKGDVLTSMLQLSASNKLTPEASGRFMSLLANLAGGDGEGKGKLSMALAAVSPKDGQEKDIYNLLNEFLHSKEGMAGIELGEGKALFNGGLREYIESGLESTSTGGRGEFLQSFVESFGKLTSPKERPTLESLFKGAISEEEQGRGAHLEMSRLMREQLGKQVTPNAGDWLPRYQFSTSETQGAAQGRARERLAIAASNLQDRMDLGAGVGVALISSLLFTGGVSAETAKEAVAGTVMAVGYSKSGKGGWLGGIGGSFRMRMAAMEGAATGQGASWAGNWVLRETLFTLGAMAGNALIQKTEIDKKLVKGIAKVFGADVKPMDFDKYANWKGASGTVAGALLSALMGSVTAMVGTQLASGVDNFLPLLGALDNAVQGSRELQRQSDERVAVMQAEGVNISAPDDPLAEALNVSYEIAQGIDDRLMGDFEEQYATISYSDSDIGEMPEAELIMA